MAKPSVNLNSFALFPGTIFRISQQSHLSWPHPIYREDVHHTNVFLFDVLSNFICSFALLSNAASFQ